MLNVIFPIYNPLPGNLERHLDTWKNYSEETRKNVRFIMVDDCSDLPIEVKVDYPLNLMVARITTDRGWNINGAKNLGMSIADNDWIFSTDADHLFTTEEDLKRTINMEKKRDHVYMFHRICRKKTNHINTFLFHKQDFWKTGGYDEDTTGRYGHSDTMMNRLIDHMFTRVQTDISNTEYEDAKIMTERRSDPKTNIQDILHNEGIVRKKMEALKNGTYKNGDVLRFEWKLTHREEFK